jgi:hypothetical protein
VDLCHHSLPFYSQLRITLERLRRDSSTERVMVVQQQLQTCQDHRSQARALERRLLLDQHLDVVRNRDANRVDNCIEDSSGVRFVELGCQVGIDVALAIGDVDGTDRPKNLGKSVSTMVTLAALQHDVHTGVPWIRVVSRLPPSYASVAAWLARTPSLMLLTSWMMVSALTIRRWIVAAPASEAESRTAAKRVKCMLKYGI